MTIQLGLNLQNTNPHSPRYLVVHSGIFKAVQAIREALDQAQKDPSKFINIALVGEKGSGKTHLLKVAQAEAEEYGVKYFYSFEFDTDFDKIIPGYVSAYDQAKAEGGVLIASFQSHPSQISNPHLRSRVLAALLYELERPNESELREILSSLMERNNFNLGEKAINYIISRVPASPLSFAAISDKLQETFREQGKSAKFSVVKDLIG